MTPLLPKTFTPHKGLMSLAERLARLAEQRLGILLWDGPDGVGVVVEKKLSELKVPRQPVQLSGEAGMFTPRVMAEQAGFIRKRRALKPGVRRVKAR